MVEKGMSEIRRMGRLRRQNEDGVNSRKVEARIGEGRGRLVIGLRNVEECQRTSKNISHKVEKSYEKLMNAAEGGIPSNNKIVDAKVTKGPRRSKKLKRSSIWPKNG
jgi:hypothetical protein